MAGGVDTFLQGLRDFGSGVAAGGEGFAKAREAEDAQAAAQKKADAERVRKERLAAMAIDVDKLNAEAQKPDFNREKFIAGVGPIESAALELGDPTLLRFGDRAESALTAREDLSKAEMTATGKVAEKKVDRAIADDKETFSRGEKLFDNLNPSRKKVADSEHTYTAAKKAFERGKPSDDVSLMTAWLRTNEPGARVTDADFRNIEAAKKFVEREDDGTPTFTKLKTLLQRWDPENGSNLTQEQREDLFTSIEANHEQTLAAGARDEEDQLFRAKEFNVPEKLVTGKNSLKSRYEALQKEKEEKVKKKEAEAKKKELSIVDKAKESKGTEGKTVWDRATYEKAYEKNLPKFQAEFAKEDANRAAQGLPPMTVEEKRKQVGLYLKANGIEVVNDGGQ